MYERFPIIFYCLYSYFNFREGSILVVVFNKTIDNFLISPQKQLLCIKTKKWVCVLILTYPSKHFHYII